MHHMRVFRSPSVAALAAVASLLAPSAARAQVGHLPDKSPYEDVKIGQTMDEDQNFGRSHFRCPGSFHHAASSAGDKAS